MTASKEERLAQLEAEAKALREEIEAEKNAKRYTHPHVFAPKDGESYGYLYFGSGALLAGRTSSVTEGTAPAFRSGEIARQYAEAHNVEIECRAQPGACAFKLDGSAQWTIGVDYKGGVRAVLRLSIDCFMFGCFESGKAAEEAIEAVGEDRIRKAALTRAGVV